MSHDRRTEIEATLQTIGFTLTDGKSEHWSIDINGYILAADLSGDESAWAIDYGSNIVVHRKTTSNFSQDESLVVLECVVRLLKKGYPPASIELEKKWRVGGYLDIYVKDDKGKAYLMIECKCWGKDYNRAIKVLLDNDISKEQILNYYLQDTHAKYLCLYTSHVGNFGDIDYNSNILNTKDFGKAKNQKEVYEAWDKVFYTKGIFEDGITAYDIQFLGIRKRDLKAIDHSYLTPEANNEGSIFNRFAEILRRHTISDKSNAYNKIFNLFLCKIVDEDNAVDENYEMEFQWKYKEVSTDVIYRLSDLYKKGMKDYMDLEIADVSEDEFNNELLKIAATLNGKTKKLKEMFKQLRLYKNNEFAFKEVIDERTFKENAEIVKEVIKLLEPYQIKYEHKQQFLGDFFERLLNIGVKQEAGQFFTPTPITTFMNNSIPYEKIIAERIAAKDNFYLPYIIDYACGSGHFLTEAIDRVDKILQQKKDKDFTTKTQKDNFYIWKRSYKWAREFIYGVEKDYRLAKTTKVACFLNGDGEARIFYADGLAPFNSALYHGKLKDNSGTMELNAFDVVIANPPFSVENFKMVLENGKDTFTLYEGLSEKSDDIECLFIERTYQLLKEGGYAGVILPSTFLLNKGIQQRARKILLDNFQIVGICEFGTKTFTYAGQPTIALFIKKRAKVDIDTVNTLVDDFRSKKKDFAYKGSKNVVSLYLELNTTFDDFADFTTKIHSDDVWKKEKEKLVVFILNIGTKVVVSNTGDKDKLKYFLGYEHSSMTKYEGIHPYPYNPDGKIYSMMYDNDKLLNPDKLNTIIYNNFLGKAVAVPIGLEDYAEIKDFTEMVDFTEPQFDYKVFMQSLENPFLHLTKYPLASLADKNICEILDHKRKPIKKSKRGVGDIPYYGANGRTGWIDDFIFDERLVLIGEDGAKWGKGENTAFIIDGKSWVNNHAHIVRVKKAKLLEEYLELVFCRLDFDHLKTRPNGGKLQKGEMEKIKFPLPTVKEQQKIVDTVTKLKGDAKWNKFDELLS